MTTGPIDAKNLQSLATDLMMLKGILHWKVTVLKLVAKQGVPPTVQLQIPGTGLNMYLPADAINQSLEEYAESLVEKLNDAGVDLDATLQEYISVVEALEQENETPLDKGIGS